MERVLGLSYRDAVVLALEEMSPLSAVVIGAVVLTVGVLMLVKRAPLIDFHFALNRAFSDSDRSLSIARFTVIGGAVFLIVFGGILLLAGATEV